MTIVSGAITADAFTDVEIEAHSATISCGSARLRYLTDRLHELLHVAAELT